MVAYKYTTKCSTPVQLFPLNTLIFYTHILNKERTVNIIEIFVKFPLFSKENITGCCCISRLDSRFLIDKDLLIWYFGCRWIGMRTGSSWRWSSQPLCTQWAPPMRFSSAITNGPITTTRPGTGLSLRWMTISGTINCSTVYGVVNTVTLNAQLWVRCIL